MAKDSPGPPGPPPGISPFYDLISDLVSLSAVCAFILSQTVSKAKFPRQEAATDLHDAADNLLKKWEALNAEMAPQPSSPQPPAEF